MRNDLTGRMGEEIALAYFSHQGFQCIERNLRFRRGEIDLIFRKASLLLFVEVKFRSKNWSFAADQLHWGRKMQCFRRCVEIYMAENANRYEEFRMEVAYVTQGRVVECYQVH